MTCLLRKEEGIQNVFDAGIRIGNVWSGGAPSLEVFAVSGEAMLVGRRSLDVYICRLQGKIEPDRKIQDI